MAAGDAGGLVDPITGEGLYYAIRSAELAARIVLDDAHAPAEKPAAYMESVRRDFAADLACGSGIAHRLFLGRFLLGSVTARAVQFARRSERFRDVLRDLMTGSQPYHTLKERLVQSLFPILGEVALRCALPSRTGARAAPL